MMKKAVSLFLVGLLLFGFGFSVLAENVNEAMYGDDDEFFDDDYQDLNKTPDSGNQPQQKWYKKLSFVPVAVGVLVGAGVVAIFYKSSRSEAPNAVPYELHARVSVTEERDRPGKTTRTSRRLTPPREQNARHEE